MTAAWGVDPSGRMVGIAHVEVRPSERVTALGGIEFTGPDEVVVHEMRALRLPQPVGSRTWYDHLDRAFGRGLSFSPTPMFIERPAPDARSDVKHGHQAVIGLGVGRVIGAIGAFVSQHSAPPREVEIIEWRQVASKVVVSFLGPTMALEVWLDGRPKGTREDRHGVSRFLRNEGKLWAQYTCGHRLEAPGGAFSAVPLNCRECSGVVVDPAEERRDRYKSWAIEAVRHIAPIPWGDVARACVERCRDATKNRPLCKIPGMSDACEAVLIALAGCRILEKEAKEGPPAPVEQEPAEDIRVLRYPEGDARDILANLHARRELAWWWLSFADPSLPKGTQFLGGVWIEGFDLSDALSRATVKGLNPGGEVLAAPFPVVKGDPVIAPAGRWRERLLTREEAKRGDREKWR